MNNDKRVEAWLIKQFASDCRTVALTHIYGVGRSSFELHAMKKGLAPFGRPTAMAAAFWRIAERFARGGFGTQTFELEASNTGRMRSNVRRMPFVIEGPPSPGIGDVVVLKSGGLEMTVIAVPKFYSAPTVDCMWFDKVPRGESAIVTDLPVSALRAAR